MDKWKRDLLDANRDLLIAQALEGQKMAYASCSGFKVGAALLVRDGRIFRGCNVENKALNPTVHAEQTAVVSAIVNGVDPGDLVAIAVVGPAETPLTPCGYCRQFLSEFSPLNDPIVIWCFSAGGKQVLDTTLAELNPYQFPSPEDSRLICR